MAAAQRAYDYLGHLSGAQYQPSVLLASARRMQRAGLERYLSAAEKRLIADNDNVDPSTSAAEPTRKKIGTHNRFVAKRDSDVVVPVNWEGV